MHEAALVSDLMRAVEATARAHHARKVVGVAISLGALSHVSAEHVRAHFALAASGTVAEGAHVEIDVRTDLDDPHAHDVLLRRVEVEAEQ